MIIKEFGHLAFNVSDMDRALHFYCGILGLEKAFSIRVPENIAELMPGSPLAAMAGKESIVYIRFGGGAFIELFYPTPDTTLDSVGANYDNIGYVHLSLVVDDIAAWETYLKEKDVPVDSEIRTGPDGAATLWIRDPDDNRIELMQYSDDSPQVTFR